MAPGGRCSGALRRDDVEGLEILGARLIRKAVGRPPNLQVGNSGGNCAARQQACCGGFMRPAIAGDASATHFDARRLQVASYELDAGV